MDHHPRGSAFPRALPRFGVLCGAVGASLLIVPAGAAPARKAPAQVTLVNGRSATLTGLELTLADGKSVAKLGKPLAGGKKTVLKLGKGATCTLGLAASFEDDAEPVADTVDICKDKSLRFTE